MRVASLITTALGGLLARPAAASSSSADLNPASRVAELLKSLSQKIEEELKEEENLFETYQCWAKSVVEQKEASNTAANARIESLNQYISDLENGRIELTTERVDLEKEIAGLVTDIDQATALREKEKADFQAAETEMQQAIAALNSALDVLRKGTNQTSFLSIRGESIASIAQQSQLLEEAVEIGSKVLSKGDALFLRRVLTADVPTKDWKKLNRKATFKQKYTARSGKIEALLQKLLEDFTADLQEAQDKEKKTGELHTKLMTSKGEQKTKAETALSTLDKENGARSMSKSEAIEERDALTTQVTDDTKYIGEVNTAMTTKSGEWKTRKELRQGEIAAISEAVSILHSDDARDLLKRSYASQGYLFLQETLSTAEQARRSRDAVDTLRSLAKKTRDQRVVALAVLASTSHFDKVIGMIDTMVTTLRDEETDELQKKETCETDRATDTRAAIKTSREIDDLSDTITSLQSKIEELGAQITEKEDSITKIGEQLTEAQNIRTRENEDYLVAKKDDEDAVALVGNAKKVLTDFYAAKFGFVQAHAKSNQPFETAAGEAPPPPPATWEAPYAGKKGESNSIVAILGMIEDDIRADLAKAKTEEDDAQKAYDDSKTALEKERTDLQTEISTLDGEKSGYEQDVVTNKNDRGTKKGELEVTMKKIKDAQSFCDYMTINFNARTTNRQIEIDGLLKAKAILQGAKFDGQFLQKSSFLRPHA